VILSFANDHPQAARSDPQQSGCQLRVQPQNGEHRCFQVRRLEDLMFCEYFPPAFKANDAALQELERVENSMK